MKKILIAGIMLMATPFVSFAQTAATGTISTATTTVTTTVIDPGLVPGDFFYFLDRWGEALNTTFTFNKEKKAKLHLEYAKERVAEMKDVLSKPNAKLEDVASAKENFDAQIADAASLVRSEKEKGADVANLARELDDELDATHGELKDIFKEHKDKSARAEEEIRAKLASLPADAPQVQGLTQALESITKEKGDAVKEEGDLDLNLMDEQATFEEVMGKELSAQKHVEQAMRLRGILEGLAGQAPSHEAEQLMKQAQEAMLHGDFDAAKRMSKEAEKGLEKAKDATKSDISGTNETGDISTENIDNLEQNIKESEKKIEDLPR